MNRCFSDMTLKLFTAVILILSYHDFVVSISKYPIVLIVSYDGFRYDYIDSKGVNPVLRNLRQQGTYAEYLNNVFITKTFPNHHSIATGYYPETHGVLGNKLFDPEHGSIGYSYEFWHYNEDILPIWIANQKKGNGRHSGIMMWPGNEYKYGGIFPTYQRGFLKNMSFEERIDTVIKWILDPEKPANLVMLYMEEPDEFGHQFGPNAPELINELKYMDNVTTHLMYRLNETGLIDHVNVFFLSDHGMEGVTMKDVIDLRKILPENTYDRYEGSPTYMIYPKKGQANLVYGALKNATINGAHFKVYKKEEIPDRYHYKNNRRAPPILAVADLPYAFEDFYDYVKYQEKERNFTATNNTVFGVHGYDNQEMTMKPYFLAVGPHIRNNYKVEPFETVDLYSLWCHMIGAPELAAKTDGKFDRVSKILKPQFHPSAVGNLGGALIGILLIGISIGISIFFIQNKLRFPSKMFNRSRDNEDSLESRQRLLDCVETEEEA